MNQANQLPLHFFVISDSIGETALKVAKAVAYQFPDVHILLHKYAFVSTNSRLQKVLQEAKKNQALIFLTLSQIDQAQEAERFCSQNNLHFFNLSQPFTRVISQITGKKPSQTIGAQHELNDEYFDRINAMEFAMRYDDGKDPKMFIEADIILLGVSRTSKTPLSMYLATMGYRVANLPLIPENELPEVIYQIDSNKMIGLTNDLNVIQKFRQSRMLEFGLSQNTTYASEERILAELEYADQVYRTLKCPVINVADRSIEETAHIIIELLNFSNIDENL
ncbi:pyruvate, water dikinase regulatory protein [Facklamia sp. 7083-14-GEN3]|uniref:pyruvate, water dikinase regulatory protein n=1 Tax=Facklamia sp. 7083-14-GEN3 TaxID=2973478 RepID=UPI00215C1A08|nr:pyruvate, water dikinase regulatory protein [Facklamia sp. 7083-14-GEN3]MCR8968700.1 kinase/pyrophosphorylase [Facklamia sp. 7083-14-GEN3]